MQQLRWGFFSSWNRGWYMDWDEKGKKNHCVCWHLFLPIEGCVVSMASQPTMETLTNTCQAVHRNGTAHRESPEARPAVVALRLHFYRSSQDIGDDGFLSYPPGDYVAEELCIDAAKACSEYCSRTVPHNATSLYVCLAAALHHWWDKAIKRRQWNQSAKNVLLVHSSLVYYQPI